VLDYLSAGVEQAVVSPGVRERRGRRGRRTGATQTSTEEAAVSSPG
jgi:hypothetical protein